MKMLSHEILKYTGICDNLNMHCENRDAHHTYNI